MKLLILILVASIFVSCGYARYISSPKSDPKLKDGVINWIKDQIDPELVKTYYELSESDQSCVGNTITYPKIGIDGEIVEQDIDMESFNAWWSGCRSTPIGSVKKISHGIFEHAKKIGEWHKNFLVGLPDSIKEPFEKDEFNKSGLLRNHSYEIVDAIEEVLNAPEGDRTTLANKHAFLAPFVSGKSQK
uniref:Uncharacterized protein n=1 Tax=Acrobeloides nanus TaxID=290746 RepID=A0A914CQN0_9BILA